ncbi:Septum formation [Pseudarthrobacter enclensis]|uniref:Septum formation-related domain-containing protein n=1 Tax=Pseudarthrobacter enclensis TaxID=993070 RepID=A0A0V8IQD3_9MICC|nr:hypothetical protein AS031_09225 [Pseudarthrobacter enclensis]SCC02369.1 Septum formation [Pseudarthrobacter enclensis]
MNPQDVPPKPTSPPTAGIPRVEPGTDPVSFPRTETQTETPMETRTESHPDAPAPASVTWSAPRPDPEPAPAVPATKARTLWKVLFAVVLLAVVGCLAWLAVWLNTGGASPEADGSREGTLQTVETPRATSLPLPREGVKSADYAVGDCFKDFDPESLAATAVPCDSPHSAQLVAVFHYPQGESYPGAEVLKAKALEACQATKLGPAANEYQLNFQRSFPSNTSWDAGDRRADCYVSAPNGNVINKSVLP